jgi:alkanesulfonate monooxygenase SsuD/methylene tetrahydromethanopterin reductase-like flavin-dependent oxidoreductase (luciferase family)
MLRLRCRAVEVRGRKLHFGAQLQAQATTWDEYLRAVKMVEELRFGSVWTFDHLLPFSGPEDRACFETLTTLGAMAAVTTSARIGVLVNGALYRHPAVLAKAAAQVDQMSGGRLDFSLGAAWAEREFRAYGLEFPPLAERYGRLEEALQVTKLLWSQRRTNFRGRYYRLEDAPCEPKPLQQPHPPVTIGGSGLGSLRAAARHADRLNLIGPPEHCAERARRLEQLCAEEGRSFGEIELSVHPTVALGKDERSAQDLAERMAATLGARPQPGRWVVGTPEQVAQSLRRYMEVGVSHFVLAVTAPFEREPLRLFQDEVVPALEG